MRDHRERDDVVPSAASLASDMSQLRDAERRAAISRTASTLSHALGTPLNVIAGRAAMVAMGDLSSEEVVNNARIIEQQVRAITTQLHTVLRFAREGWEGPEPTELGSIARRAVELLAPEARDRGVQLTLGEVASIEATSHPLRVLQVVTNLMHYALARADAGSEVTLSLRKEQAEPPPLEKGRALAGPAARFRVHAASLTLPDGWDENVYEPWLHDAELDRMTAMLFAVSFGIAREHRGWVEVHSDAQAGTTLLLSWPLAAV